MQASELNLFGVRSNDGEPITDRCAGDDCLNALFVQLFVIMTLKQVLRFILGMAPAVLAKIKQCRARPDEEITTEIQRIELEYMLPKYPGVLKEFNELVIQYGYLVLFSVAFPVGALLCFVNNIIERRSDAIKVLRLGRRPPYRGAEDIGTWQPIVEFLVRRPAVANSVGQFLVRFRNSCHRLCRGTRR